MKRGVAFLITLLALIPSVLAAPRFERTLQTLGETGNFILRLLGNKPIMIVFLLVVIWWGVSELLKIILKQSLGEKYQESYSKLIVVVVAGICLLLFGVAAGSPTGTINAILSIGFNATFFLLLLIVTVFAATLYSWLKSHMGRADASRHNTGVVAAALTISSFAWSTVLGWLYLGLLSNFSNFRRVSNGSAAESIMEFSEMVWIFSLLIFIFGFFFWMINKATGRGNSVVEKFSETEFKEDVLKEKSLYAHAKQGLGSIGKVFGDATESVFGSSKPVKKEKKAPKDPFETDEFKGFLEVMGDVFEENSKHLGHIQSLVNMPTKEENPFLNVEFLKQIAAGKLISYNKNSTVKDGDIKLNSPLFPVVENNVSTQRPLELVDSIIQNEITSLNALKSAAADEISGEYNKDLEIEQSGNRIKQSGPNENKIRHLQSEQQNYDRQIQMQEQLRSKARELRTKLDRLISDIESSKHELDLAEKDLEKIQIYSKDLINMVELQKNINYGSTAKKINSGLKKELRRRLRKENDYKKVLKSFLKEIKDHYESYKVVLLEDENKISKLFGAYLKALQRSENLVNDLYEYYNLVSQMPHEKEPIEIKGSYAGRKVKKLPVFLAKTVHHQPITDMVDKIKKAKLHDEQFIEELEKGIELFEEEISGFEKKFKLNEKKK